MLKKIGKHLLKFANNLAADYYSRDQLNSGDRILGNKARKRAPEKKH